MASKQPVEVATQLPKEAVTVQECEDVEAEEDVEADVWKGEWDEPQSGGQGPGKPPAGVFMTLQESKSKLHEWVWEDLRKYVWNSVVLIKVPTGPHRDDVERGTGFVLRGVQGIKKKLVITCYHVVKNHNSSSPIRVIFFHDDEGGNPVECEVTGDPVYYSQKGEKGVDEKHLDFAVLDVKGIPDEVIGIPCDDPRGSAARCTLYVVPIRAPGNLYPLKQGVIVGYPGGHRKRISIVDFQFEGTLDIITKQKYSQEGTWKGSSGSPVLVNDPYMSPLWSVFLHYGVVTGRKQRKFSVGINMVWIAAKMFAQAGFTDYRVHPNED